MPTSASGERPVEFSKNNAGSFALLVSRFSPTATVRTQQIQEKSSTLRSVIVKTGLKAGLKRAR